MGINKIKSREDLVQIRKQLKEEGKKIVFTNGVFDILHVGHIRLLEEAKSFGDILIVAINVDTTIRSFKDPDRPYNSQDDRAEVLAALECVDYVTFFEERRPSDIIKFLQPDIHVKGGDYDPNDYSNMPEAEVVHNYGGKVKIIKIVDGKSTTNVIEKIRRGVKQ